MEPYNNFTNVYYKSYNFNIKHSNYFYNLRLFLNKCGTHNLFYYTVHGSFFPSFLNQLKIPFDYIETALQYLTKIRNILANAFLIVALERDCVIPAK